jgi:mono/diheme cytochrome c family protein
MAKFLAGLIVGFLLLPLIIAAAARFGLLPLTATAPPPRWETRIGRAALRASVARRASHTASPVPVTDDSLRAGMRLYRMNCAGCHGDYAGPSEWGATGFYPRVPQFADEPSRFTAPQMFFVVKNGVRYSGMGAWEKLMSDDDIWRVVGFLSRIRSLPPAVDAAWKAKRPGA